MHGDWVTVSGLWPVPYRIGSYVNSSCHHPLVSSCFFAALKVIELQEDSEDAVLVPT